MKKKNTFKRLVYEIPQRNGGLYSRVDKKKNAEITDKLGAEFVTEIKKKKKKDEEMDIGT